MKNTRRGFLSAAAALLAAVPLKKRAEPEPEPDPTPEEPLPPLCGVQTIGYADFGETTTWTYGQLCDISWTEDGREGFTSTEIIQYKGVGG